MKVRRLLFIVAALLGLSVGVYAQNTVEYGYFTENDDLGLWGTEKAETYNLAIKIDNPALQGFQVCAIKIPLYRSAGNLSGHEAFLTHTLSLREGKAVADIVSVPFTAEGHWTTVNLPEPYTIGTEPFYAGFTFTVDQLDATNRYPVKIAYASHPNGFMVATSESYRTWQNYTELMDNIVPIALVLKGDIAAHSAKPSFLENVRLKVSTAGKALAVITNLGTTEINNVDYVYEVSGKQTSGHLDFAEPIRSDIFASSGQIEIDVPALDKVGIYEGQLRITQVNGVANNKAEAGCTNQVNVMDFIPVHRAVMEEFTGTWCQYCPRGWVAMEKMKELYPDKFIALSYHNNDIMEITDVYPVNVAGFPSSCIDRGAIVDPYYGSSVTNMGIEQDWLNRCKDIAPADIDVTAQFSNDRSKIEISSQIRFAENLVEHPYSIAYTVTADGLKGEGADWMQVNAYSGMRNPGDFEFFANSPNKVSIEFNDVVIAKTDYKGVEGSLPAQVTANEPVTHAYSFDVASMHSAMYSDELLIQDYSKVNVVVLLINNNTGMIENARKCRVTGFETGIEGLQQTSTVKEVERFNLSGVRVDKQYKGFILLRMSDGSVKKVIQK